MTPIDIAWIVGVLAAIYIPFIRDALRGSSAQAVHIIPAETIGCDFF